MLLKQNDSLSWQEFELLAAVPGLVHGVFSRRGGVSQPPFDGLNVSVTVGDLDTSVTENRRLIQNALALPSLTAMHQVHGNHLITVADAEPPSPLVCDGLMTSALGKGLLVQHADCQAALIYDPIHHVLAAVHVGWRGLVQQMYSCCIQKLQAQFGSKPQELLIGISPSLGPARAEFIHYQQEFPQELWAFADNNHMNLWEIARYQLEQCGVLPHHIEVAQICTYAQGADYFSYRREKCTGRNGTVACLF